MQEDFFPVFELSDFHNDAVSGIQALWNESRGVFQAWTSSWDKSICVWDVNFPMENDKLLLSLSPRPSTLRNRESKDKKVEYAEQLKKKSKELQLRRAALQEKQQAIEERTKRLGENQLILDQKRKDLEKKRMGKSFG